VGYTYNNSIQTKSCKIIFLKLTLMFGLVCAHMLFKHILLMQKNWQHNKHNRRYPNTCLGLIVDFKIDCFDYNSQYFHVINSANSRAENSTLVSSYQLKFVHVWTNIWRRFFNLQKTDFFEHQQEIMLLLLARMKLDSCQWNSRLYYKHITIVIDTASVVSKW
jgi:hypothetical protein